MADYGLTPKGVNIKRLDTILEEMHEDLSEKWGINTRQNPESLLNVILTNVADRLAELWELGQDVYYSTYPLTAEGLYLDAAGQFAGITRESAAPSYYHIKCTGVEGTVIPADTIISTNMNPSTDLRAVSASTLSRSSFNEAYIKIVSLDGNSFNVILNDSAYSYSYGNGISIMNAMKGLANAMKDSEFEITLEGEMIHIKSDSDVSSNRMILSDNLTTDTISCVFMFATEENGDIYLPNGAVTEIKKAVSGLKSVVNVGSYIAGQQKETDTEFRQSYIDKIFSHSSRMVESIRSAILANCQGVKTVAVYENVGNEVDEYGRPPHSIEVVADGGDETEIAQQIYDTKAAGINSHGSVEIQIANETGDPATIRFNRPEIVQVWFKVKLTSSDVALVTQDFDDKIRALIMKRMENINCGENIVPQNMFLKDIYANISGMDYVEILIESGNSQPSSYQKHILKLDLRQRAKTDESMIDVELING